MEMTNRRWMFIVALICLAIVAIKLPPEAPPRGYVPRRAAGSAAVAGKLHQRLVELNEIAELLARRDSLLRASTPERGAAARLVPTASLRPDERETLVHAVSKSGAAVGSGAGRVIVGVAMDSASDIPKRSNYRTERQVVLPQAADGHHCITIVRLGRGRREIDSTTASGILGPCAFYAAFGEPGPAIAAWLRKREYDVAFNALWPDKPEPQPALLRVRQSTRAEDMARWMDFMRGFRHYDVSACAGGSVESCETALHKSPGRPNERFPDGIYRQTTAWEYSSPLGHHVGFWLSDLLASQGRARFQKFWSSSAPDFNSAFQQSFGERPGKWTMRWMRYRYGRDTRGPYVAPRSAIMTVVASLGIVALTIAVATQREVLS